MAIGRPVILSDIGGAREMIDDGVEGYVVSPHGTCGATAGVDRGAVCRPAQAPADGSRRAAPRGNPLLGRRRWWPRIAHCWAENRHDTRPSVSGARAPAAAGAYGAAAAPPTPAAQPVRVVTPTRRIKVVQFGPALDVRGGITTVEQLICDYLAPYVSIRHVATMDEGSKFGRAFVYARAVRELRRVLASIDPCIVHIHFASRGSTLRKMILADMVTRAGRPLVLHAHGGYFDQFHRRLPAVLRRTVDGTLQRANVLITLSSTLAGFLRQRVRGVAFAGSGAAKPGALDT